MYLAICPKGLLGPTPDPPVLEGGSMLGASDLLFVMFGHVGMQEKAQVGVPSCYLCPWLLGLLVF